MILSRFQCKMSFTGIGALLAAHMASKGKPYICAPLKNCKVNCLFQLSKDEENTYCNRSDRLPGSLVQLMRRIPPTGMPKPQPSLFQELNSLLNFNQREKFYCSV